MTLQNSAPLIAPWDEYNQALVANVHPLDWKNPTPAPCYNLVVIGAGVAGLVAAAGAAGLGAKVALIEQHLMGGDCTNVGCVPSKSILRAARAAAEVRDGAEFGIKVPPGWSVDFAVAMRRMRRIRAEISRVDAARRFSDELGVDVFLGSARFAGQGVVEVGGAKRTIQVSAGTSVDVFGKKIRVKAGTGGNSPSLEGWYVFVS